MNVFELMTRSSHRVQAPTESQILPECTDTGIDEEFDEDDEQPLSFFTLKEKKLDRAIESSNRFEISTDNQTVLPDCTDTEIDEEPDEDDVQPFTLFNLAENELNNATNTRCRDPVYDLFTLTETPSIVICNQEYCSAKLAVSSKRVPSFLLLVTLRCFQKRASTLKRHLRRFHITAHDILAESTSSIAEIALDFRPLSLPTPKKKNEKKASSSQCRRDPVYNLFTSKEDPSVVICKIDNCSTKLAVNSVLMISFTVFNRNIFRESLTPSNDIFSDFTITRIICWLDRKIDQRRQTTMRLWMFALLKQIVKNQVKWRKRIGQKQTLKIEGVIPCMIFSRFTTIQTSPSASKKIVQQN